MYPACMSPTLNGSSTLEHFECNRNPGLSTHHLFICFSLLPSFLFRPSTPGATNSTTECIFAANSPLYTPEFRNTFRPIDGLVNSCENLLDYWEYLISLMSLSFMGLLMSVIAITSNCITPCVEERYNSWGKTDV